MLLSATTDKLSLITEQAGDIDVVVTFIDRNQTTGAVGVADRQITNITTATTTDILAAPAATTERKVQSITIRNAHASTSMDLVVQYNANGTLYEMHAARLYSTEMLEWSDEGFELNQRRDVPLFASRLAEGITRTSTAVTGSDAGMSTVSNCLVNVEPTKAGAKVRTICSLYLWHDLAAATTTGVAIGQILSFVGFTNSNNQALQACVASVTAATLSSHDGGAADSLIANGTSAVADLMGIGGGSVKWTESAIPVELQHQCILACQSEVGASQITISKGTWFQLFESTEV